MRTVSFHLHAFFFYFHENSVFPPNSIIAGVSAKVVATRDNSRANINNAEFYHRIAGLYANGEELIDAEEARAIYSQT